MRTLLTPTVESELELEFGQTDARLIVVQYFIVFSSLYVCVCVFAVVLLVLLRFPTLSLQFIAVVC